MSSEPSLLFPRLPQAVAQREYERILPLPLDVVSGESGTFHPDATVAPIGGVAVTSETLKTLRDAVVLAAVTAGFPNATTTDGRATFDLEAARIISREMQIVPAE